MKRNYKCPYCKKQLVPFKKTVWFKIGTYIECDKNHKKYKRKID